MSSWLLLNLKALLPFVLLAGGGALLLIPAAFSRGLPERRFNRLFTATLIIIVTTLIITWRAWLSGDTLASGLVLSDRIAYAFDLIFLLVAFLTVLLSRERVQTGGDGQGDYFSLLLFSTAGMSLMAHSGDLILLFIALELMSLAAYILSAFQRDNKSAEAALKYFILGSFASAFLLYGIALIYGATGTTHLSGIAEAAPNLFGASESGGTVWLVRLSVALLLVGLSFKIAAVPFHLWMPDVYEGSPTPVTAFMASGVKAAAFVALIRVALAFFPFPDIPWTSVLSWLAILTMTLGNLIALKQSNIKRMLAYSSIAHTGYALIGVATAMQQGAILEDALASVFFYLLGYALMTTGAFAVVTFMGQGTGEGEQIGDYAGLGQKHPMLALTMTLFMISLTGIPPTVGFIGKFTLFKAALDVGLTGLVIVAVLNSAVSAFYYLGVVSMIYFHKERDAFIPPLSTPLLFLLGFLSIGVLYFGLFPEELFVIARETFKVIVF